jgi:hypothetical protein
MTVYEKYFDRIGEYGLYARNTSHHVDPFAARPVAAEFAHLKANPHIKFIQVRYSWKALQPLIKANPNGLPTQAAYTFDTLVGPLLEDCHAAGIRCKIELMWTLGDVGTKSNPPNVDRARVRRPVPLYMFNDGFHLDPNKATSVHGGGCYLIYGTSPSSPGKLWPRLWVPAVGEEFALMCEMLLKYISSHRRADAFNGIALTETLMQQANEACRGNTAVPALNFSSAKLRDGYLNITNRIADTWNGPFHTILLNHGMLRSDTANGGKGGLTESDWKAWFDQAFTQQGFAISLPDAWEIMPGNVNNGECEPSQRIDTNPVSGYALRNYRDKTIVSPGFQKPSTFCRNPGDIIKWGANLPSPLRPSNGLTNGFNAGGWVCAAITKRVAPDPEARLWPNNWGSDEYIAAAKNISLHTGFPPNAQWVRAGSSQKIPAPGDLTVGLVGGASTVSWTYSASPDLSGFKIWISDTQGGAQKSGTTERIIGSERRSIGVARLVPPLTAYWVNVQATAATASQSSDVRSVEVAANTELATPAQVCVDFANQKVTWTYTDNTATPVIGFKVYVNTVLYKMTGPTRREGPLPLSELTSGQQYVIKVEAVGSVDTKSRSLTLTYSGQTTGSSCNP